MWAAEGDGLGLRTLWTDAPDAMEQLAARYQRRQMKKAERDELAHFIEHGWLVWPKAIEPELIDRFAADVRGHHAHPGKFLTTNHRKGRPGLQRSGSVPDRFESLFDLYVNLESSRAVCLHPRIVRFLTLVFDAPPIAFQQLLFQRSNGHQVHQDTSVVAVEDPQLLVATWIALEDVVEGSGELAFYDRSQRLPHWLFKDGTKRCNFAVDDQQEYQRELDAACRARGMAYERFLAKKGDVFIWTADLVHRSHPRTLAEDTSRLSCVTHYHPATTTPFWFNHHPTKHHIEWLGIPGSSPGTRAGYVSLHYRLPVAGSGMAGPESPYAE